MLYLVHSDGVFSADSFKLSSDPLRALPLPLRALLGKEREAGGEGGGVSSSGTARPHPSFITTGSR